MPELRKCWNGPEKAKALKLKDYQHTEWKHANEQTHKDKF